MSLLTWVWPTVGLFILVALVAAVIFFVPKLRLFGNRALKLAELMAELEQLPLESIEKLPTSQLGDDPVLHIQSRLKLLHRREREKQQQRRRLVSRITNRLEH